MAKFEQIFRQKQSENLKTNLDIMENHIDSIGRSDRGKIEEVLVYLAEVGELATTEDELRQLTVWLCLRMDELERRCYLSRDINYREQSGAILQNLGLIESREQDTIERWLWQNTHQLGIWR